MKTSMVSRIGYRDVFNQNAKIDEFLNDLNVESALEFLVLINKYEYKFLEEDISELNFICSDWLSNSDEILKNSIIESYTRIIHKNQSKRLREVNLKSIRIINKAATLRAIEVLLSRVSNCFNKTSEKKASESLFLFYLTVNDEIAQREDKFFNEWMANMDDRKNEIRFHLFLGLSQLTLNQEKPNKKIWVEILKFVQFEKWIKNQDKYKNFTVSYLNQFDLSTWYELITVIYHLNDMAINHVKFSKDLDKQYWKMLSYFAEHNNDKIDWNELTQIRKKPLYKLKSGDYLVLDFGYLLDKFFSGIYHDMLELSKTSIINKFHQDYSKDFIEGFLLSNSLNAVFGKSYIQFNEEKIKYFKVKGIENLALPDYYIRNGNKVFLIECKNSFISNRIKSENNCEAIEKDIIEKFYQSGNRKKAIKQLVNFIELSVEGKYLFFDKIDKLKNLRYYPILVVTDATLNSLGFNQLFNEYFSSELKNHKKDFKERIKPLTIIHINDLLYRTSRIKKLDMIIDDYHNYCCNNKAIESMISFSDYLDLHKFKNHHKIDQKSLQHIMKASVIP